MKCIHEITRLQEDASLYKVISRHVIRPSERDSLLYSHSFYGLKHKYTMIIGSDLS